MGKGLVLAFAAILIFTLLPGVIAVPFAPTATPTSMNAGQSSQLINFTVQNIGSVNITQLNITLPPSFTFTGALGTTTTSYTASTTSPSWINGSSIGIVGNGATQNFWIYVNTPSTTGSYSFNVTTLDANTVFNSSNVTFSLFDTTAPTYSSNGTSPASNTTYAVNQSYWFNITWTDNLDISKVLLEHNLTGSGTPHNDTMSNVSGLYYLNAKDLSAGAYVWRVYANDTNNTFNSTPQFVYSIRQATNTLSVYLNNTLNSNITSLVDSSVNVTGVAACAQSACNITISRDGTTIASVKPNPFSINDAITTIGLHNYTVSVTGNTNYTSNSATFYVATTPGFTTSTSNIPLTFSNSTSSITVTFNSIPNLADIFIQGTWSGTNITLTNSSTTVYSYNATLPAGGHTWIIFGTYSNHTFNIASGSFTINKASPTLTLGITPQWTLDTPVQTNVSCSVGIYALAAKLYRNETAATNPDVQTFSAGSIYIYTCNNTVNQNYTTDNVKNTLYIRPKTLATLSIVQSPAIIEAAQNSSATSEIKVKNTGTVIQSISVELEGLDSSWYSIDKTGVNTGAGINTTFLITFNLPSVAEVKEYKGKFTAKSSNDTISQDFTLKVLPSAETKIKINDTIALYKLDASKLESKFNEVKDKINNTENVEQKINDLKAAIKQAGDYVNANDYFQAQQTFETIKALVGEVENQLKAAETGGVKVGVPSAIWMIVIGVIIVIVVGVLAFLFWPVRKGYKTETGYVYGEGEEKRGLVESLKKFVSKFKRKKKTETVLSES
ncbi:MAG: hypothetical protein AABW61_03060 [Candidatus Aenigmatarchaeota archaeon]